VAEAADKDKVVHHRGPALIPIDYNKAVIAGYVVYGHRKKWFSGGGSV
jgi:hypothetical protein